MVILELRVSGYETFITKNDSYIFIGVVFISFYRLLV